MDQDTITGLAIFGGIGIIIFIGFLFDRVWYGMQDKLRRRGVKFDYQLELICGIICMGIAFLVFIPIIGIMMHNIVGLIGFGVAVIYPLVVMYLRPGVFGEKMQLITTDMRIYRVFVLLSVFAGGYFTILSFSMLNFHFPLGLVFTFLILGLFAQTVPLYFDLFDRFLPVDLGMERTGSMDSNVLQRIMSVMGGISVVTFICVRFVAFSIKSSVFGMP